MTLVVRTNCGDGSTADSNRVGGDSATVMVVVVAAVVRLAVIVSH